MAEIVEDVILDALDEASTIARAECEEVDFSPTEQQWNQFAKRLRTVALAGLRLTGVDRSVPPASRKRLRLCPRSAVAIVPHDDLDPHDSNAQKSIDTKLLGERLSSSVQPPHRAINLAEATQAALCSGKTVVSRKSNVVPDAQASSGSDRGIFWEVTATSARDRRSLYTGGVASELDLLAASSSTSTPSLPTPAAVKHSELNFRAECAALERQIHVDTKLALLQGMQPLREVIGQLKQRRESRLAPAPGTAELQTSVPWVAIEAADHGVCSLVFRGALRVFLLWDSQSQHWNVWKAEWLWKARVVPCGVSTTGDVSANGVHLTAPVWLVQQAPVMTHMKRAFAERGFAEGCLSAIFAVAGLWMELCDQQTSWIVGELAETLGGAPTAARISVQLDTQVNSGFISVFFTAASPSTADGTECKPTEDRSAVTSPADASRRKEATLTPRTSIQTKWLLSDGTVYRISQLGTDVTSRVVVDVLDELASQMPQHRIVDVEPTLWNDWMCAMQMSRMRKEQ